MKHKPRALPINRDEVRERNSSYYEENKEEIKLRSKLYYETHREREIQKRLLIDKTRGKNPKNFRLPKDTYERKTVSNLQSTLENLGKLLVQEGNTPELPKGAINPWGWGEYYGEPEVEKPKSWCNHDYINVGFHHDKWVCSKCDQEKSKGEDNELKNKNG